MTKERTTITLPRGMRTRAHKAGINISGVTSSRVSDILLLIEKETGANLPGPTPATTTSKGRAS